MSKTPICDFVAEYIKPNPARFHMPGHKGQPFLGCEAGDITEIDGADGLYASRGIIAKSEQNASRLFGCPTFYSAEGCSLAIRAMLHLATAGQERRVILAGRNAHTVFIHTAALLDLRVEWLYPKKGETYLACTPTPGEVEAGILTHRPCAVYITSPDYLGHTADIAGIAEVCRRHGVRLLVDNAHGAYLRFLSPSRHPMDLGADLCCDSAHKTLPALTGGAYLHVKEAALADRAKDALALFGSTSPSWLILQSLDRLNPYLEAYPPKLAACAARVGEIKEALKRQGFTLVGEEPLKITLAPKSYGYAGDELAAILAEQGIAAEFHDPDYLTLMAGPENREQDFVRLSRAMAALPQKTPVSVLPPPCPRPRRVMSPRAACFAPSEQLPPEQCVGRVLAAASVGCPPAVPPVICGEEIDQAAAALMAYYGIGSCTVVKK